MLAVLLTCWTLHMHCLSNVRGYLVLCNRPISQHYTGEVLIDYFFLLNVISTAHEQDKCSICYYIT